MSLEGLAALIVAVVTLVSAALGWRKMWRAAHRPLDMSCVLDRMEADKAEVMSHVTANRVQAMRHTNKMIAGVYQRMDEGHSTILDMLSEVEVKVTKPANNVSVRKSKNVAGVYDVNTLHDTAI